MKVLVTRENSSSREAWLTSNSRPQHQGCGSEPSVRQLSARRFKDERRHGRGNDNTSENGDSNSWGGSAASVVVAERNGEAGAWDYHMRYSQHVNAPPASLHP